MKEKWLNRIAVVGFIVVLGLLVWWLFRPQPMPFTLRARWKVKGNAIGNIAFSPKGDWLAASGMKFAKGQLTATVNLWRVPEGKSSAKVITVVSQQIISERSQPFIFRMPQIAFSPDGQFLAVGYLEQDVGKVALFNVSDGRRLRTITMGKSMRILAPTVNFAPDGRLAVIHDSQLWFVSVEDGRKTPTKIRAETVAFSPDGQWLAAVQPNSVSIYNAKGHLVKQIRPTSQTTVLSFETAFFSEDGQNLFCFWSSKPLKFSHPRPMSNGISIFQSPDWQLKRTTVLASYHEPFSIRFADFAPHLSLTAFSETDLNGWDGAFWRLERFVYNLLGKHYPSATPTQVVLRRLSDGQIIAKLPRHGLYALGCAFSPDGRYLAVSHGNTIALWERKGD
ncbi:WD40 repeat domain-containing protein [Fervidibacter sacchari]|mgnify:CR=1 FL=1|uniref:WD40 repeat protein n=1 Tax=Candidatus Fervidibacter sacchari TaxID=1448929 RepID=A0ABT2EKH1_9BACT|nr:WD40 repeat domain-containing protein [Candidatus Fervidibacter sacchari]MCS3917966.1 WD40 repeat protein [Candidatus Fervidibacter sacchari]WKU15782.1 WD40 repeat domain-containing protein [Candidatus Fervidibacter sacchari]